MSFPYYHIYESAIASRNLLVLLIAVVTAADFAVIKLIGGLKPRWSIAAIWIVGVGGFYALLGLVAIWSFTRAAAH